MLKEGQSTSPAALINRKGGARSDSDRHILLLDAQNCLLYELNRTFPAPDGSWEGDSGAMFALKASQLRPFAWTSTDAA